MNTLKNIFIFIIILIGVSSCRMQEKLLFYPEVLPANHAFSFNTDFKELTFKVDKNVALHGVLCKADTTKGLVFYLHGNAGSIDSWGSISPLYLQNNFDFFILDYRGYGKSQGKITCEKQMHTDIQYVYDSLKTIYKEKDIVIIGYSLGTGFATKLAAENKPKMLILKAPYFSMEDLAHVYVKALPTFLIRYKIKTNEFIQKVTCPITIFHGDKDEVIYYGSSEKLQKLFKKGDRLVSLKGQTHNGINSNSFYVMELHKILK